MIFYSYKSNITEVNSTNRPSNEARSVLTLLRPQFDAVVELLTHFDLIANNILKLGNGVDLHCQVSGGDRSAVAFAELSLAGPSVLDASWSLQKVR